MRRTGRKKSVPTRVPTQREILRDVMLSAAECDTWLTLRELSLLTRYGEASISAQLRHLRKPRYGAFVIAKQHRRARVIVREEGRGPVAWEYQLRRGVPRATSPQSRPGNSIRRKAAHLGAQRAV